MYEFLYHLRSTLILLGGEKQIADLLNNPEELGDDDVKKLCRYNIGLTELTKDKLNNISTTKVVVGS
jgi:hypothetical protein